MHGYYIPRKAGTDQIDRRTNQDQPEGADQAESSAVKANSFNSRNRKLYKLEELDKMYGKDGNSDGNLEFRNDDTGIVISSDDEDTPIGVDSKHRHGPGTFVKSVGSGLWKAVKGTVTAMKTPKKTFSGAVEAIQDHGRTLKGLHSYLKEGCGSSKTECVGEIVGMLGLSGTTLGLAAALSAAGAAPLAVGLLAAASAGTLGFRGATALKELQEEGKRIDKNSKERLDLLKSVQSEKHPKVIIDPSNSKATIRSAVSQIYGDPFDDDDDISDILGSVNWYKKIHPISRPSAKVSKSHQSLDQMN